MLFANMQLLSRCPMESHTFAMNLKCRHIWTWQTFPCIPKPRSICYSWMMYLDPPIRPLQKSSSTRLATRPLAKKIDQGMFMTGTLWWKYLDIPFPFALWNEGGWGPILKCDMNWKGDIWLFCHIPLSFCSFCFTSTNQSCRKACQHAGHRCYRLANSFFESPNHLPTATRTCLGPRKPACYHHMRCHWKGLTKGHVFGWNSSSNPKNRRGL